MDFVAKEKERHETNENPKPFRLFRYFSFVSCLSLDHSLIPYQPEVNNIYPTAESMQDRPKYAVPLHIAQDHGQGTTHGNATLPDLFDYYFFLHSRTSFFKPVTCSYLSPKRMTSTAMTITTVNTVSAILIQLFG